MNSEIRRYLSGQITAVCRSGAKGERKKDQGTGRLIAEFGLEGDAHAGNWHRQVSLLAEESIARIRQAGVQVGPGDFAENLTVRGIELHRLPIGTQLAIGAEVILEVTQIGKECHAPCAIHRQAGMCVMPTDGIFTRVRNGGPVTNGDQIRVLPRYRVGIVTASDKGARGERNDESGPTIAQMIGYLPAVVEEYLVLPDDQALISSTLCQMVDERDLELVLTTGGTGLSPRDCTPEATLAIAEREVPGMAEAMRAASMAITPRAMLSRGVVVIRGRTLIINLPGSPKAVRETLEVILPVLPHALETLRSVSADCAR